MTDTLTAHSREWPLQRRRTTIDGTQVDVLSLSEADRIGKEALDERAVRRERWQEQMMGIDR